MEMVDRKKIIPLLIFIAICLITLITCILISYEKSSEKEIFKGETSGTRTLNDMQLKDNSKVYLKDKDDSVVDLYVTVKNRAVNERDYTLDDVNGDEETEDGQKPSVEVIMQEGTEDGPQLGLFGYGLQKSNGVMELRGMSSKGGFQKCYAITLFNNSGLWNGQRKINLNKHESDITRVRNKLCFDYFKMIPDITSCRTQFVHLKVKDLSGNKDDIGFVDYGLYTHVEQINKQYLKKHGLDPNGQLYKAMNFEFYRYEDEIKNSDDPSYDKKGFESRLEIKGKEDHLKLIGMLEDLNDDTNDINEVIKKHFNRDNYLTWLASNILMDNVDTYTQNFFLYSPLNSDVWYFLPWDYDGSFGFYEQSGKMVTKRSPWETGASNYWSTVLYRRFMKDSENVKQLTEKVKSLSKIINRANTGKLLGKYFNVINKFVRNMPDIQYLPGTTDDLEYEYKRLLEIPEKNLERYFISLEVPMPFYMGEPELKSDKYQFKWEPSYDLGGSKLTYLLEVCTNPDFLEDYFAIDGLSDTTYSIEKPPSGKYYWRVVAINEKGKEQVAFEDYVDELDNSKIYFGTKTFIVK